MFTSMRTQVRFLADLVNAKVVASSSIMSLFDTFITVTYEPDIPRVSREERGRRECVGGRGGGREGGRRVRINEQIDGGVVRATNIPLCPAGPL